MLISSMQIGTYPLTNVDFINARTSQANINFINTSRSISTGKQQFHQCKDMHTFISTILPITNSPSTRVEQEQWPMFPLHRYCCLHIWQGSVRDSPRVSPLQSVHTNYNPLTGWGGCRREKNMVSVTDTNILFRRINMYSYTKKHDIYIVTKVHNV